MLLLLVIECYWSIDIDEVLLMVIIEVLLIIETIIDIIIIMKYYWNDEMICWPIVDSDISSIIEVIFSDIDKQSSPEIDDNGRERPVMTYRRPSIDDETDVTSQKSSIDWNGSDKPIEVMT